MEVKYAQIDDEGYIQCISYLSAEVNKPNMIKLSNDFDVTNKKYDYENKTWITYEPEPGPEQEPTETELIQAELLLNQQDIIIKQSEHDEVLAAILLGQQTV